jgi:hypothetical protein
MMLAAITLAAAHRMEPPSAYIERLYSSYGRTDFNPLGDPARYFAPRLLAAINEDSRLSRGEVGYLDGDPICQCQDPAGLKVRITARNRGPRRARIEVLIRFAGENPRPVTFSLVQLGPGWRIADISSPDEPSLLSALERSNLARRASH